MHFSFNLQPIIHYLNLHPHSSGIIAFLVVFMEAMAVIGVLVPGTITMTAIGVLIGSNVIPAGSTFIWAIAGAITGDVLSYLIGVYYQDRLHRLWPFSKYKNLLDKSETFFRKHGGKSVFLGRFIGPMRAMTPMVAGMLKMSPTRFLFAAIPSVTLWVICYLLPGIILGALSLELPPQVATKFILAVLAIVIFLWLISWLLHHCSKRIYRWLDKLVMKLWVFLQRHKTLSWITKLLADPHEPENHQQLSLFFLAIISGVIFLAVFKNISVHGVLTVLNDPLYNLLRSFRSTGLDHVMLAITFLGESTVLFGAGIIFLGWLVYKRYWYMSMHWLLALLLGASAILGVKGIIFSPRPNGLLNFQHTSSFPSGHTLLSLTFFGFWAVMIARELKAEKCWIPYAISSALVFLIATSRLYLGAHWLTDVVGSFLLGLTLVIFLTISYRRQHKNGFSLKSFISVFIVSLTMCYGAYTLQKYSQRLNDYSLKWPAPTITLSNWQDEIGKNIPLYRLNRLGRPIQAFNLQWLGTLEEIQNTLQKHGWVAHSMKANLSDIILNLAVNPAESCLPLFPQLYHNRPIALLMTKKIEHFDGGKHQTSVAKSLGGKNSNANNVENIDHNSMLVLRLWQSDIKVDGSNFPLWLGAVDYQQAASKLLLLPHKKHHKFLGAVDDLATSGYVNNFTWKKVVYPLTQQPVEMHDLAWNGVMFLVHQDKK